MMDTSIFRHKEEQARRELLNNPMKMKQLEKAVRNNIDISTGLDSIGSCITAMLIFSFCQYSALSFPVLDM